MIANKLAGLEPASVFAYFEEICSIPHGSRNTKLISDYLVAFAQKHGLFPHAGSDAHVYEELGGGRITLEVEQLTADAVKAALLAGQGKIQGKRTRAWCIAQSQYTKRKKLQVHFGYYVQWFIFAVKCVLQDLLYRGGTYHVPDCKSR